MKLKNNIRNRTALALSEQRRNGLVLRGGAFKSDSKPTHRQERKRWRKVLRSRQIDD